MVLGAFGILLNNNFPCDDDDNDNDDDDMMKRILNIMILRFPNTMFSSSSERQLHFTSSAFDDTRKTFCQFI